MKTKEIYVPWYEARVPEKTRSYQPISHKALIALIESRLEDFGYTIISNTVQQNTRGTRIAGTFVVSCNNHEDVTMMLAYTNSYDKSLAIKLASGASVFVCENGMIVGDLVVMRMHTSKMLDDLTEMIDGVIINLLDVWKRTVRDIENMKKVPMPLEETARLYGELYIAHNVVTSVELNKAVKELKKPTFIDFEPHNMWSSYNHMTWALKNAPPHRRLDCLKLLHEVCTDYANDHLAMTKSQA